MKSTIKAKLYFGAILSFTVIALLAGLNVYLSRQGSATLEHVHDFVIVPAAALEQIQKNLFDVRSDLGGVLAGTVPASEARARLLERRRQISASWSTFEQVKWGFEIAEEEKLLTRRIGARIAAIQPFFDALDSAYLTGDRASLEQYRDSQWAVHRASLLQPLTELLTHERKEASELVEKGKVEARNIAALSLIVIAFSMVSAAWFVTWLVAYINRGIANIHDALAEVAEGRLDVTVEVTSRDEIADMAASLNRTLAIIKTGQEKLQALQRQNQLILSAIGEGLFGTDARGRITYANPATEKLLGWTAPELAGKPADELTGHAAPDGQGLARDRNPLTAALRDGAAHHSDDEAFRRKDGSVVPVEYTSTPVLQGTGIVGSVVVFRDITERKQAQGELMLRYTELQELNRRLEEAHVQLLQSEKMASVGQLAAGVAHEINNPIGFVKSNLSSLREHIQALLSVIDAYDRAASSLAEPALAEVDAAKTANDLTYVREDIHPLLEETLDGVQRVQHIVRDLKDFSHPDEGEWQMADLHQGLDSTLNVVWNELKYKADVVKEYGAIPQIECMPGQINQVFMNILVNAAQAMEDKGTITLRTGCEGDSVWIEIADDGKGIPPQELKRIFEPFFTTKPVGMGTGLGLSLSYGIVERHGGRIDVESEVGKGTVFRIWLPVSPLAAGGASSSV